MSQPAAQDEIKQLRQRVVAAEVALMMFLAKDPRIDPYKMLQAYLMAYPEPFASPRAVEMCVAAKESGENTANGRRVS